MSPIDLDSRFPQMTPIKSAPSLMRFNGIGTTVIGNRNADPETGTYITTLVITILYIPLFALRAYRVGRAEEGGWYFLGREPLSPFAKIANLSVLTAILCTVAGVFLNSYLESPAYKARQEMAQAASFLDQNKLADAAKTYQTLALAGEHQAPEASKALLTLVDSFTSYNAPLEDYATILTSAATVARKNGAPPLTDLVSKGLAMVSEKGADSPPAALAILQAIRPLALDSRPIDAARLPILRKQVALDPTNLEAATALADMLEQKNAIAEARAVLLPVKDKLGNSEGARVLGYIFVREGKYDDAYALLWPYTKDRLDKYHAAEKAHDEAATAVWSREMDRLKSGKAPKSFYEKYEKANDAQQEAMVRDYILNLVKNDRRYNTTQKNLEDASTIVPVALELGIVMLHRAQNQPDPALRKTQLEATEKIFLSVQAAAGESDEYRMYLAQVYYWLGKQADGRKLFDELLAAKSRSFEVLYQIAGRLYSLGSEAECRELAEEAYAKNTEPEKRFAAAYIRARASTDLDDRIEWLRKSNTEDKQTSATLSTSLGQKAFSLGHDDEAAKHYQAAIEALSSLPRSSSTLNEIALASYSAFNATGDRKAFERCVDSFQQAVALDPSDPVLTFNAAATIDEAAYADIIGTAIDLRALRAPGSLNQIRFIYSDEKEKLAIAEKINQHPGMARARSFYSKAQLLSPNRTASYTGPAALNDFLHDDKAIREMRTQLSRVTVDSKGDLGLAREFISGTKDSVRLPIYTAAIKRSTDNLPALRAKGGKTAAAAIAGHADLLMDAYYYIPDVNPEEVVKLAREAYAIAPTSAAYVTLRSALLFQIFRDLSRSDPDFDAYARKYQRTLGPGKIVAVLAGSPGPLQQKVLAHPNMKQVTDLILEVAPRFPKDRSVTEWSLLRGSRPAEAAKAAELIRSNASLIDSMEITSILAPFSVSHAVDLYWVLQLHNKNAEAQAHLDKFRTLNLPIPPIP